MTQAAAIIQSANEIVVVQKKELVELFGLETRKTSESDPGLARQR